ncbi:MAG: hypothetical protein JOY61_25755 [Chloroflexi bacterium]|nr:hypothetical protein [Chloroflexota bacterium]
MEVDFALTATPAATLTSIGVLVAVGAAAGPSALLAAAVVALRANKPNETPLTRLTSRRLDTKLGIGALRTL